VHLCQSQGTNRRDSRQSVEPNYDGVPSWEEPHNSNFGVRAKLDRHSIVIFALIVGLDGGPALSSFQLQAPRNQIEGKMSSTHSVRRSRFVIASWLLVVAALLIATCAQAQQYKMETPIPAQCCIGREHERKNDVDPPFLTGQRPGQTLVRDRDKNTRDLSSLCFLGVLANFSSPMRISSFDKLECLRNSIAAQTQLGAVVTGSPPTPSAQVAHLAHHAVTGHTVFPRRCQPIFLIAFSDSFSVCPADGVCGAREWDRILACVGTSGIPTVEEQTETGIWNARQRRPGGLRVLSPRPPLKDFTKEMGLLLTWCTG
jgi:hypothetical protein